MNNNTLEFGVSREGNGANQMIADIRKYQQEKYERERSDMLDALGIDREALVAQYQKALRLSC
jgi:hypothetical protein